MIVSVLNWVIPPCFFFGSANIKELCEGTEQILPDKASILFPCLQFSTIAVYQNLSGDLFKNIDHWTLTKNYRIRISGAGHRRLCFCTFFKVILSISKVWKSVPLCPTPLLNYTIRECKVTWYSIKMNNFTVSHPHMPFKMNFLDAIYPSFNLSFFCLLSFIALLYFSLLQILHSIHSHNSNNYMFCFTYISIFQPKESWASSTSLCCLVFPFMTSTILVPEFFPIIKINSFIKLTQSYMSNIHPFTGQLHDWSYMLVYIHTYILW